MHPIDRPQKYIYDKYNKFPNIINDVPVFNFLIKYVTFIYFFKIFLDINIAFAELVIDIVTNSYSSISLDILSTFFAMVSAFGKYSIMTVLYNFSTPPNK